GSRCPDRDEAPISLPPRERRPERRKTRPPAGAVGSGCEKARRSPAFSIRSEAPHDKSGRDGGDRDDRTKKPRRFPLDRRTPFLLLSKTILRSRPNSGCEFLASLDALPNVRPASPNCLRPSH